MNVKFVLSLFAIALSLTFTSCSKDNEKEGNPIVGVWKYQTVSAGNIETNSPTSNEAISKFILEYAKKEYEGMTLTLKENGYASSSKTEGEAPYTFANGILTIGGDTNNASIDNGILTIEVDYTGMFSELELDDLINIGITSSDMFDLKVTKAIVKISFNK